MDGVAKLLCAKVGDTNANVRKAAINSLKVALSIDDAELVDATDQVVDTLSQSNPRAYKTLKSCKRPKEPDKEASSPRPSSAENSEHSSPQKMTSPPHKPNSSKAPPSKDSFKPPATETEYEPLSLEAAIEYLASAGIPSWGSPEDECGILEGLKCECFVAICRA